MWDLKAGWGWGERQLRRLVTGLAPDDGPGGPPPAPPEKASGATGEGVPSDDRGIPGADGGPVTSAAPAVATAVVIAPSSTPGGEEAASPLITLEAEDAEPPALLSGWTCEAHRVGRHDFFLSYRVKYEGVDGQGNGLVKVLSEALEAARPGDARAPPRVFWDRLCLNDGAYPQLKGRGLGALVIMTASALAFLFWGARPSH